MNGLLIVNKEKNYTSRDVVNIISKKFKTKKVGHTGTLDPLATGVLVVTIGEATKVSELLTATYKEYIAEVILGINTDTLDITGNILEERDSLKTKEEIKNVLNKMTGTYLQEVPIYSAVKVNGKKLYEYARNNEEVILPKKEVTIKSIDLLNYKIENNKTIFKIKCLVSKGTYIRSLVRDIASKLNTIGVMSNLNRTKQGKFDLNNSYTIDQIKAGNFELIKIEDALDIKIVEVDNQMASKIKNGSLIDNIYKAETILLKKEVPLAIYHIYQKDSKKLKPWKIFNY